MDNNNLQKELKIESLLSCESVELTSRTFSETEKNHNNSDFGKFNWQRWHHGGLFVAHPSQKWNLNETKLADNLLRLLPFDVWSCKRNRTYSETLDALPCTIAFIQEFWSASRQRLCCLHLWWYFWFLSGRDSLT